jgi:adenosylcobinamide-GDP ribazoletransferase
MASAFRKHTTRMDGYVAMAISIVLLACICISDASVIKNAGLLAGGTIAAAWLAKTSFEKHFGGITGDTLGAFVEGAETWLWCLIWLLRSSVTG